MRDEPGGEVCFQRGMSVEAESGMLLGNDPDHAESGEFELG